MALRGKMLLALAVSILVLTLAAEARCLGRGVGEGECGEYFGSCSNGLCCSKFGYCGITLAHCGDGCQPEYGDCNDDVRALGRGVGAGECGGKFGKCSNGLCCSQFGFCGDTDAYCGNGCQHEYGNCNDDVRALGRDIGAGECGGKFGKCSNGLCCSQFGFCGDTDAYCGNGCQPDYGTCSGDNCLRASTGKASYYNKYIPSACYGNDEKPFPRNRYMAAVSDGNPNLWKNGQGCGNHYRIRCEGKGCRNGDAITIKVVDRCPNGCEGRVFDLSEEAFSAIADKNAGVIKIQHEPVNDADAIPWEQKKLIVELK